jgi:outer membrane receptor protein involved in Fe transport
MSAKALVTDFVEEVQVKSSGYAAEYSGALGGVVNVITRGGTNDWKGSLWAYYSGDVLGYGRGPVLGVDTDRNPAYADGRPTLRRAPTDSSRAEYVTYDEDGVDQIEPGFSLGGPLVRDRALVLPRLQPEPALDRPHGAPGGRRLQRVEQPAAHGALPDRERHLAGRRQVPHAARLQQQPHHDRRSAAGARRVRSGGIEVRRRADLP